MSTKTCLLCGRALGRMRMNTEGDFCSREHRSQYRLRRSMECLTEANKVATLARRRESPKPLFGKAVSGSQAEQRGFFQNAMGFGKSLDPVMPSFRAGVGSSARLALHAAAAGPAVVRSTKLPAPERRSFGVKIPVESSAELAVPRAPRKPAAKRELAQRPLRSALPAGAPGKATQVFSQMELRVAASDRPQTAVGDRIAQRVASAGPAKWRPAASSPARRQMGPLASVPSPSRGRPETRMAFVEMALTSPQEAARMDWIGVEPEPATVTSKTPMPRPRAIAPLPGDSKGKVEKDR